MSDPRRQAELVKRGIDSDVARIEDLTRQMRSRVPGLSAYFANVDRPLAQIREAAAMLKALVDEKAQAEEAGAAVV